MGFIQVTSQIIFRKWEKKIDSNAKTKRFQNRQSREKEEHENESKKNKFA